MRYLLVLAVIFASLPVSAQIVGSESFSIRLFGLADVTAPSTPSPVTATAVANTQIDISWGVSTDDYYLSGYVLFRNGVPIATTTLTNFSDVGLTASTTYNYYVKAFDSALNYSASSVVVSATTLGGSPPATTTTETTNSQNSTAVRTSLSSFSLTPHENSADFYVRTARPAQIEIRWGKTASYELGYTFVERYQTDFHTKITDLEPGTRYQYEVLAYNPRGVVTVLKRGEFTTLNLSMAAPANVLYLNGTVINKDIKLTWQLPNAPVQHVRIVRSHLGFPNSPNDGAIVYQGLGTEYLDRDVLSKYSPAYYTVFVYDHEGNVSSGAVLRVALGVDGVGVVLPPGASSEEPGSVTDGVEIFDELATTSDQIFDSRGVRIPRRSEISIITSRAEQTFSTDNPAILADEPFAISIPVNAFSKNLKTIIISFSDPLNKNLEYSYILRLNKNSTAYEALIEPLGKSGSSNFTVALYDYEARIVARYKQQVQFDGALETRESVWFPDYFYENWHKTATGVATLLLILAFIIFRISRR